IINTGFVEVFDCMKIILQSLHGSQREGIARGVTQQLKPWLVSADHMAELDFVMRRVSNNFRRSTTKGKHRNQYRIYIMPGHKYQ
ncbi:hypothetical protein NPIL_370291, partial [Nephila pilipes]